MDPLEKPNILIVDDEEPVTQSLARGLRDQFTVFTAPSGQAALDLLAQQPVEVVIADQHLKDLSGVQLLARIKQHHPQMIGFLTTSDPDLLSVVDTLSLGILRGLFPKPLELEALRQTLAESVCPANSYPVRRPLVCDAAEAEQELSELTNMLQAATAQEVEALLDGPRVWSYPGQPLRREYLENLSDGFALLRGEGELVYCNPAFARLLSLAYPLPRIITLLSVPHLAACAPLASTLQAGLRGERAHLAFSLFDHQGRRRYLEMAATGVTVDPGVPQAVLIVRDDTQREQLLTHLRALNAVAETISQSTDLNLGLAKILSDTCRAVAGDAGLVYLFEPENGQFTFVLGDQVSDESLAVLTQHPVSPAEGAIRRLAVDGQARAITDLRSLPFLPPAAIEQEGLVSAILAPLHDPQGVSGMIAICSRRLRQFSDPELQLLTSIGRQVGLARHNARLHAELEAQARTDPLTGLLNRRAFMELAEHEYLRARRQRSSLAALMIDLDDFKDVNDRYGHAVGDVVLRVVAQTIQACVRNIDVAGRYGGDEFVLLLPDCSGEAAGQVARRLSEQAAAQRIVVEADTISPSLSVGCVAAVLSEDETLDKLLSAADSRMYAVKHQMKQERSRR